MCFPHPWRARHLFVQVLLILLADVANAEASRRAVRSVGSEESDNEEDLENDDDDNVGE